MLDAVAANQVAASSLTGEGTEPSYPEKPSLERAARACHCTLAAYPMPGYLLPGVRPWPFRGQDPSGSSNGPYRPCQDNRKDPHGSHRPTPLKSVRFRSKVTSPVIRGSYVRAMKESPLGTFARFGGPKAGNASDSAQFRSSVLLTGHLRAFRPCQPTPSGGKAVEA